MKFSVIVPAYNVEKWIGECLDSLLAQTFPGWEAICVDDGSTDGTGSILDEYARMDARFKVVRQRNGGEGAARNAALDAATGEWIVLLDGDDVFHPDGLRRIAEISTARPDLALVRFGNILFRDGDACTFDALKGDVEFAVEDISSAIPMETLRVLATRHAYRRELLGGLKFPRYLRGSDRLVITEVLLKRADAIAATHEAFYGYRQRATSAVHKAPSVQVLVDEMDHRCDIVEMIESGRKKVSYAGDPWLEGFFTIAFGRTVAEMSARERKVLWGEWHSRVRRMQGANGLSPLTRFIYAVSCALPCRPVWWILCRAFPWYVSNGLLPRIRRAVLGRRRRGISSSMKNG